MRKQWRCYHCDQVFTNQHEAGIHFGADEAGTCACVLPHEQHLVEHIRDLERQLGIYRTESDHVMRSIMMLEDEHRRALRREEEKGYERGLRDGTHTEICRNEKCPRGVLPVTVVTAGDHAP